LLVTYVLQSPIGAKDKAADLQTKTPAQTKIAAKRENTQ